MKYDFINIFTKGEPMGGTLPLGYKDEICSVSFYNITFPSGLKPELVERTDEHGRVKVFCKLYTPSILECGTFGFMVKSDTSNMISRTYVFGVAEKKE